MAQARLPLPLALLAALAYSPTLDAQRLETLGPQVRKYVSVATPRVILEHVEIIDGTGAAPVPDRNLVLENGRIAAITPGADLAPADGMAILDLKGDAVMPGIVGMHATSNGATYLGRERRIGSIAVGKNADLVVLKGDPAARITDIENVQLVFKDGVAYDPAKLLESVKGHYGEY